MPITVATIDVGGTGANSAASALTNLGAAPTAAYAQANTAYSQANSAYGQANTAYGQANTAYGQANLAYTQANSAFSAANNTVLKAGDTMTGVLSMPLGNSAAPSIRNSNSANTGVYFPANTETAIVAGGTVAAAFNSNGLFFRNRIINGCGQRVGALAGLRPQSHARGSGTSGSHHRDRSG